MNKLTIVFPSKNKYTITHSYTSEYLQYLSHLGNTVVEIPRYEDIFKDIILNHNCTPWIGNDKIEEYAMIGIGYFNCKELLKEFYELRKERRRKELLKDVESFFESVIEHANTQKLFIYSFWEDLCSNNSLSEQFFEKYKQNIVWEYLCTNTNITEKYYEKNIDKVCWEKLLCNPNISEQFYEDHIKDKSQYKFLRNKNVSEQFIERYYTFIDKKWLYTIYNLSYTFIDKHLNDKPSNYEPPHNIKIKYLLSNPYINNEECSIRYKLNIEKENTKQNINQSRESSICVDQEKYKWTQNHKDSSEKFFETHLSKIHWDSFCYNTNITEQFFEKHLDKINWDHLILNTNISPQFFKKYIRHIPFPGLCSIYGNSEFQYFSNITKNTFEKYIERILNNFKPN